MYDKIKMYLPLTRHPTDITQYLQSGKQQTDLVTGEAVTYGTYRNMRVSIYPDKIRLEGSLARVIYPNNIYPLELYTTREAINALSDGLHLDISQAVVTSLEYGTQYVMQRPVCEYLPLLGDMPRLQRLPVPPNSLYYMTPGKRKIKEFYFYDKQADALAKGLQIPGGLEHCNLLKFEMRLNGRLYQQLKVQDIRAATLWDRDFYRLLMRKYQDSYFSISTSKRTESNVMTKIQTVSDALNVFMARLLQHSTEAEISTFLSDLKAAKVFDDRKYYTRLKDKITALNAWKEEAPGEELIKELDDAIKNVGAYV